MDKVKTAIALVLLLFINFAFSVKYISRITPYYLCFSFLILGFYITLWSNRIPLEKLLKKFTYLNTCLIIIFIFVSTMIFIKIPTETLNVDRWSVITSFWDNYFSGKYVYFAKSVDGNYPGPMPFYFFLALPFYLIEELGYFSILGIIVFLFLLKYTSKPTHIQSFYLLLVMLSTFMLWEVVCRSNVFLNGCLVLFSLVFFFRSLENNRPNYFLWNGLFIGLMLSTRNVFIIPYIITFLFALKQNRISLRNTFYVGIIATIIFAATFIPFVFNHFDDFKKMNPFKIQSSFLMPTAYSVVCVLFSTTTFFVLKRKNDVYFYSGLLLFMTIIVYFVYLIKENNFEETFFNSRADISYFILCIPFLLYYVIESESISFSKK
jgi:hypothetical protein